MVRTRFRWQPSARALGSAFALSCLVFSCSLRDTSSLDSGEPAAGSAGLTPGAAGNESAGRAGSDQPSAGSGGSGLVAGSNPTAGTTQNEGGDAGTSDAGGDNGGSGGAPVVGAFINCPGRYLWVVDSNPTSAQVQAAATQFNIPANMMLPQYAIDDADMTGTGTRFSTGRVTVGDEYISVDMGAERWVSGVYTKENSGDFGRQYEVSVSRDGLGFVAVGTHEGMTGAFDIQFAPVIARFVRLSQKGTTETEWWSLHDYKVYCTADAVPQGGAGGMGGGGSGSGGASAGAAGKGGNAGKGGGG